MQTLNVKAPEISPINVRSREGGVWTEVVAEEAEEDGSRNSGEELGEELEEERVIK